MKTLTKIRLINWHYFENETINIKGNTLLTGMNASGKSTILDAVSFVLTGGDQNFNLAANDKGKRDLRSYCKCKLGSIDQEYLRDYDLSTHICLEFYSEKQEKYFCLGTIIDVVGNVQPVKTVFYMVDRAMDDIFFLTENSEVKNSLDFKKEHITDFIYQTKKEAKSAFRNKLGGISEKYYTLLPKALAFKPISDVKDYIYNQLLEQKEIDVKNIQDSIRSYKEFEGILKQTKAKINDLELITNNYFAIKDIKENQEFYEYLLKDIKKSDNTSKIDSKSRAISKIEVELESIKNEIKTIEDNITTEDDRSKEMYASLSLDKDFRAQELYDKDINKATSELEDANALKDEFIKASQNYKASLRLIQDIDNKLYTELSKVNLKAESLDDVKNLQVKLKESLKLIDDKRENLSLNEAELNLKKNNCLAKIQDVYKRINSLSKNDIPYREEIVELRQKMEKHLENIYGEHISVHILAEVLEIKDDSWADTIEDFLGSQRFTLIVEPKYYNDCLNCYDENKSRKLYGISLLNTKKIQDFTQFHPDSLASIIETDNKDAKCYINYLCGNLIMVDNVNDLEKHTQSITKDGMLYRGYTTRYLNPNTEKPFIGRKAKEIQSVKYEQLGKELKDEYQEIIDSLQDVTRMRDLLSDLNPNILLELLKGVRDSINLEITINELKDKKNKLSLTTTNDLRKEYENIISGIKELNAKKDAKQVEFGSKKQAITNIENEILVLVNENQDLERELKDLLTNHLDYETRTKELFKKEQKAGKTNREIEAYYNKEITEQLDNLKSLEKGLVVTQVNYISKYNRPFATGFDNMSQYLEEQDKLVKSELIKYEAKVRDSREEAEKLFKEDFLSKLRSYILEAQDEISKINETLDHITFGQDKYQFIFPKSKEFGAIYEMIVNDSGATTEYSIFNEEFERKYNQELDELFENLSHDEENSQGNLNKYTDYRTYMDYDIKITSGDDTFYYSNISAAKSGGETQIPFYVAILASFVRLFDKAEKSGLDDSVGLIFFDEVFDKMDSVRIDAMMEFISQLNVQVIFACPQQKMEALSKHTKTTIVVFRSDKQAQTFVATSK